MWDIVLALVTIADAIIVLLVALAIFKIRNDVARLTELASGELRRRQQEQARAAFSQPRS